MGIAQRLTMAARTRAEMMQEIRAKLIASGRKAFAEKGFSGASMDDFTAQAQEAGKRAGGGCEGLLAEGNAYIEMALRPEVQRIVLLDGPSVLGDPSQWPSQNRCLQATIATLNELAAQGAIKPVDIDALARLLNGLALNAALWVASSETPEATMQKATVAFECLASGIVANP